MAITVLQIRIENGWFEAKTEIDIKRQLSFKVSRNQAHGMSSKQLCQFTPSDPECHIHDTNQACYKSGIVVPKIPLQSEQSDVLFGQAIDYSLY